jgi:alpha-L-rhamnosidase
MSSDLARHGNFKCSDETVNKLFEMTKNSDRSNFYYYPTDCPHREKNGWTGDVATSCFHMMMLYDCKQSFKEWLANVRKSQNDVGALPGIVPTAGWGYDWGNGPAWDRAAFYLPYECWRLRGDTQIIKDNAHMMMRYLDYIMTRRNEDGTVSFGLGDWASVGRRYSQFETPLVVSDSILVMDMAKKAAEMFEAIGQTHSANYARGIYLDMRNTIRTELLDKGNCILAGRTQTAQAMGLYHGIFDPDEEQKAFSVLLDLIHEKNDSFDCGILGCMKIFHVLSRFGEGKLAFKMITKKEFPSYGHLIEIGMTSLPERFMPDGAPCDSHNHHFFGDIARWFIREIAGLRVENYKTVVIKPDFTLPITSAQAYYELPSGKVSVKWETENDGKIRLEYVCPEGVDVSMILPEGAICCIERRTA